MTVPSISSAEAARQLRELAELAASVAESHADAVAEIRELNAEGAMATVDVLGEEVNERARAQDAVQEYLRLVEEIERQALDANISIKLTQLGLHDDPLLVGGAHRLGQGNGDLEEAGEGEPAPGDDLGEGLPLH